MQEHILAAMRELFERWEELLGSLSVTQITSPLSPSPWSIKDEVAHLWTWQQRSIARLEAALAERIPEFPGWLPGVDEQREDTTDQVNDQIYQLLRDKPWAIVHQSWQEGFLHLLEVGKLIAEKDLLDPGRYRWLNGHSLAFILVASYDHHKEHLDKMIARLQQPDNPV
jgi:hypothetical protein